MRGLCRIPMKIDETKNPWTTVSTTTSYENPWIQVSHHDVLNPAGKPGIYGKVHYKNIAIGILPLDEDLNTWLVGQYRYPIDQYTWEIPEGGGPLGSPTLASAKRELQEETGISAEKWIKVQEMHLSNSVSDECSVSYVAQNLSYGEAQPEETEELQIRKVTFDEALQLVLSGKMTDGLGVATILKVAYLLDHGQL